MEREGGGRSDMTGGGEKERRVRREGSGRRWEEWEWGVEGEGGRSGRWREIEEGNF